MPKKKGAVAREALMATAMALFSDRGFDAVSAREIALAAGQRNESAVGYYFGNKDGLINAILGDWMVGVNARRLVWLAAIDATERDSRVLQLVAAITMPLAEVMNEPEGQTYIRFLARLVRDRRIALPLPDDMPHAEGWRQVLAGLRMTLDPMPHATLQARTALMVTLGINALVDWSEASRRGDPLLPLESWIQLLIEAIASLLLAPPSRQSAAALVRQAKTVEEATRRSWRAQA